MGMTLNNRNAATIPARIKQLERIKRDELNGTIVFNSHEGVELFEPHLFCSVGLFCAVFWSLGLFRTFSNKIKIF